MFRKFEDLGDLNGKTVLVRCNFDGERRIDASVPFLKELAAVGAKTIVLSHLGRPKGREESLSLQPVFERLRKALGEKIFFGSGDIEEGEILLKENLRFDPREEQNDDGFAKELAALGDFYINNDFATAHRAHASVVAITKHISSAAGPLLQKEVEMLEGVVEAKEQPLIFLLGGAKPETKLPVIKEFLEKAGTILLGGVLANTILKKKGVEVGASVIGDDPVSESIVSSDRLVLPKDAVVSTSLDHAENMAIRKVGEIKPNEAVLDIGPETRQLFAQKIAGAGQIVWNGPLGRVEIPEFRPGSLAFAQALVASSAQTLVGGGDIVSFLAEENLLDRINHVSTGGGAMLAFLAGERLPALEALGYYDKN